MLPCGQWMSLPERAARIAAWAGRQDVALEHTVWLARRDPSGPALEKALNLARGLNRDPDESRC
jgi:hypothetical protein